MLTGTARINVGARPANITGQPSARIASRATAYNVCRGTTWYAVVGPDAADPTAALDWADCSRVFITSTGKVTLLRQLWMTGTERRTSQAVTPATPPAIISSGEVKLASSEFASSIRLSCLCRILGMSGGVLRHLKNRHMASYVQKYGPYAKSRNMVADRPRYKPLTPSCVTMERATDHVDGFRWIGADCCRILMSSVGQQMRELRTPLPAPARQIWAREGSVSDSAGRWAFMKKE